MLAHCPPRKFVFLQTNFIILEKQLCFNRKMWGFYIFLSVSFLIFHPCFY